VLLSISGILRSQTFASLRRHHNYRLYFCGQFVSQIGTWLQNAGQAWLILDLTHSATQVGVFGFCLYAPYAIVGLAGGAIADRVDRRRTLMITQAAMGLCAVGLALVSGLHVNAVWLVDLIAVIRGIVLVFNNPARQAFMVELVGRAELPNAIALNSSLNNATRIIGPATAGVLISTIGVAACFALNALSFIAVLLALASMRPQEFHRETSRARGPLLVAIRDGLRFARRRKTVAVVLAMLGVISMMAINFDVVLPMLARGTLGGSAQTYGTIASAFGVGALAGALISASRRKASRGLVLVAAVGFGICQCLVGLQHTTIGVALFLTLTGVFYTLYTSSTNSLVQLATPGYMQGRVGGLYNYVFLATGPLGSLIAGKLADFGGAAYTLYAGGAACLVMAGVGFALRPWPMPTGTVVRHRRTVRGA